MILARHKYNPPDEVMFAQLNPNVKRYSDSIESKLKGIIKDETGVDPLKDIKYRGGRFALSRQLFMVMMKLYTFKTLQAIADPFNTSHDYVLYCEKTLNNRCDTDKRFKAMYDRINEKAKKLK